jgi:hypothetical protein
MAGQWWHNSPILGSTYSPFFWSKCEFRDHKYASVHFQGLCSFKKAYLVLKSWEGLGQEGMRLAGDYK